MIGYRKRQKVVKSYKMGIDEIDTISRKRSIVSISPAQMLTVALNRYFFRVRSHLYIS